jgi:hypothetical protein
MASRGRWACGVALAVCLALGLGAHAAARGGQPPKGWDPSLLEQWLTAVEQHEPGRVDTALAEASQWNATQLHKLWGDVHVLLVIAVAPRTSTFYIPLLSFETGVRGRVPVWISFNRRERDALNELATRVRARGVNQTVRRATMLHTDVLTMGGDLDSSTDATLGPPTRWAIGDGTGIGAAGQNVHWELARAILAVTQPDPRRDLFVRDWYRATVAHGQSTEYFDALHLAHGVRLFPDDPELLLMAGAHHEALATPLFQAFAQSVPDSAVRIRIGSAGRELSEAAAHYRRALTHRAGFAEARVRLGRVLELQGHHADAVRELRQVLDEPLIPVYRYAATLFLGVALEGEGDLAGAAERFQSAAGLYPGARSPYLALARVSRELGDRELTASSLARAMAGLDEDSDVEPWWLYRSVQGRMRLSWMDDVRQRARSAAP